jgi:site-specific DNA recombinase
MKTALYIRVSTQEQAEEGHSIGEQTDRLNKYCEAKGWTVVKIYTDPGFSGGNTDRPALKNLIRDIDNFDMILVYKLDRLSRSQKDTLYLIEDVFLKHNVDFVSMNENFDTSTPFGRAMIGILSVFAQLEREQIKERMSMGHIGRAKEGYWRGGSNAPIGYDFIEGKLVINEYESMQVKEIFNLFIKGYSIHSITEIMKSRYSNRYSSWNNSGTTGKILRNTMYIGKIKYKGEEYDGQHEPIICEEIFNTVQIRYNEIEKKFNKAQKSPYMSKHLLSGLIFCGNCGARYFTKNTTSRIHGTFFYYKCYSRDGNKEMKKIVGCKNPIFREDVLDNYIINAIKELSDDKEQIKRIHQLNLTEPDGNINILKNRIEEIDKQIGKLLDLYQFGTIPIDEINKRTKTLQGEKESLEREVYSIMPETPVLSIDEAHKLSLKAIDIFVNGSPEQKRRAVSSLINKIVLYSDTIKIYWKFCA